MKKYFLILFVAVIGFGCAVYTPAGNWDYSVIGTPNGDVGGTLVLTEIDGTYTGKLVSDQGDLELENVKYSEENGFSCTFWFQDMEFSMMGTFVEDTFKGTVDGGPQIGSWPMTAKRVVEK